MILEMAQQVREQLRKVVVGNRQTILWTLAAILAKGHILLEDIPGVGKTSLTSALAVTLGLQPGRVQFTSDVLPADVVGYHMPEKGEMVYKSGPVMCNLFLADELNRATSRSQSALLEAMEENQVTVDGVCYQLPQPFFVIATQNPAGPGIQPMPDGLLDRFALRLRMGYPEKEEERSLLLRPAEDPQPVITASELMRLQSVAADTYVKETVADYGVRLVASTRKSPLILRGGSPRATISVMALAKAWARLQGRDFVTPEDVQASFLRCLPHRILARGNPGAALRMVSNFVRKPKK